MTREIESMPPELFNLVADQIEAHSEADWKRWEDFATKRYKIGPDEMSENHFFLYMTQTMGALHKDHFLYNRFFPIKIQ